MSEKRYKVTVLIKAHDPRDPGTVDASRAFNLAASTPDKAATLARARLEGLGATIAAISHGPGGVIYVTLERTPRKAPPATLVAAVDGPRPRKRAAR